MSCTSIGALRITVTLPVGAVAPLNGYRVKYRPITPANNAPWTYFTQNQNPIVIPGVSLCDNLEGTVEADCGNSNFGTIKTFYVPALATPCKTYRLTSPQVTYTYFPCNSDVSSTIFNTGSTAQNGLTICAKQNTVTGGGVEDLNQACTP